MFAGYQRRFHPPARPSFFVASTRVPARRGTCRLTVISFGRARNTANGPIGSERSEGCCGFSQVRLPPRRNAPRRGAPASSAPGHHPALRQTGAGRNAPSNPALVDPRGQTLAKSRGTGVADIPAEHDHRQLLVRENCVIACCGAAAIAPAAHRRTAASGAGEIETSMPSRPAARVSLVDPEDDADRAARRPSFCRAVVPRRQIVSPDIFKPRGYRLAQLDRKIEGPLRSREAWRRKRCCRRASPIGEALLDRFRAADKPRAADARHWCRIVPSRSSSPRAIFRLPGQGERGAGCRRQRFVKPRSPNDFAQAFRGNSRPAPGIDAHPRGQAILAVARLP